MGHKVHAGELPCPIWAPRGAGKTQAVDCLIRPGGHGLTGLKVEVLGKVGLAEAGNDTRGRMLQVRVDRAGKVGLSAYALLENHIMHHSSVQGFRLACLPCPLQSGGFAPAWVTTAPLEPGQRFPKKRVV